MARPDVSIYLLASNAAEALDFYVVALGAEAGAKLLVPIETMTVDEGRRCRIADPAGHVWTLAGK